MTKALAAVRSAIFVVFLVVTVIPWAIVASSASAARPLRTRCGWQPAALAASRSRSVSHTIGTASSSTP